MVAAGIARGSLDPVTDITSARHLARVNGADELSIDLAGAHPMITARSRVQLLPGIRRTVVGRVSLEELGIVAPVGSSATSPTRAASGGAYHGPLANVDGVPICPRVGVAYRIMQSTAKTRGIVLRASSGYRSVAEQAILYSRLGPRLAAPPGRSLHHAATELDIHVGPAGSPIHSWLRANGPRFGFIQRYSWEPWHWGNVRGC